MATTPAGAESSVRRVASGLFDFTALPPGVTYEIVPLAAQDGGASRGVLYRRGGEKTVVCFMHPRGDMSRHYAMPGLLEAGYATFGHQSRYLNNDIACLHEALVARARTWRITGPASSATTRRRRPGSRRGPACPPAPQSWTCCPK